MQMLFAFVEGQIVPKLPAPGQEPDGVKLFTLEGAAKRSGVAEDRLRTLWMSQWGDYLPPDDAGDPTSPAAVASAAAEAEKLVRHDVLRRLFFSHLVDDEDYEAVLRFCLEKGLSPWSNHVHAELRWDRTANRQKLAIMVRIDGFRALAAKTGVYAGSDAATIDHPAEETRPVSAGATVYRLVAGQRCAFSSLVFWDEFYPIEGDTSMWDRMPKVMITKVAEAHALRKAFPELAGVYAPEELDQSRGRVAPKPPQPAGPKPADADVESPAAVAEDDDAAPQSQRQLELWMMDLGVTRPEQRQSILRRFRARFPGLQERDAAGFYRKVWSALRANPAEFGAAPADMAN